MTSPTVAVIGAGPAGAVSAALAARLGFRALLFDDGRRPNESVELLSGRARRLLTAIAGPVADDQRWSVEVPAILSGWSRSELVLTDTRTEPTGPGLAVLRADFDDLLRGWAVGEGAEVLHNTRVIGATAMSGGWNVRAADGSAVRAEAVILASGRRRPPPWRLVRSRPPALALTGRVRLSGLAASAIGSALFVERAASGWSYVLSDPRGGWFAGTCLSSDRWVESTRRPADVFGSQLSSGWLHDAVETGGLTRGRTYGGEPGRRAAGWRWAAVGDAARAVDPLSGRGMEFAIESGARVAKALAAARGADGWPHGALDDYQTWVAALSSRDAAIAAYLEAPTRA